MASDPKKIVTRVEGARVELLRLTRIARLFSVLIGVGGTLAGIAAMAIEEEAALVPHPYFWQGVTLIVVSIGLGFLLALVATFAEWRAAAGAPPR